MSNKTKICPKCRTEIDYKASICPNCKSKLWSSLGTLLIIIFIWVIIIWIWWYYWWSNSLNTWWSVSSNFTSLEKMELVFIWSYSKEDIKLKLDNAMLLYWLEINENNYNKAWSVLVSLRKKTNDSISEMDILNYMINSYTPWVNMSFPDIAWISAWALYEKIDSK